jgi:hypothetical protein
MTCLSNHQLRALSAAAGVVGRPHLRAGLLLTLAVACGPAPGDDGDAGDASSEDGTTLAPSSTSVTSTSATSTGQADTSSGATDDASSGDATSSTTADDLTTSGGTLLTDATSSTTGATDTGDAPTSGTGDTGGLSDCIDPSTQETDWACCEKQNWEPFPQCTPWGPPAPPTVHRDLLARARAARTGLA